MSRLLALVNGVRQAVDAATSRRLAWGIDIQISGTKPATRSDSTALVAGDRWLDTSDRIWFFWDGTYWLSEEIKEFFIVGSGLAGGITPGGFPVNNYNIYLLKFVVTYNGAAGTYNGTNFWAFGIVREDVGSSTTEAVSNLNSGSGGKGIFTTDLNVHRDTTALGTLYFRLNAVRNGTPPNLSSLCSMVTYRLAKP